MRVAVIMGGISSEREISLKSGNEVFNNLDREFFDYNAKYEQNGAQEEVVYLEVDLQNQINEISKTCWDIFHCKAYVRIDIIIYDGIAYVLELNTLLGLTKTSLISKVQLRSV